MGGFCETSESRVWSRLKTSMRVSKAMRFPAIFVPNPSFQVGWTTSGLRIPEALQLWCQARCTCDDMPDDSPITNDKVWISAKGNSYEVDVSGGGLAIRAIQNGVRRKQKVYIQKGTRQQDTSNTCSINEPGVCNSDFPASDLDFPSFDESIHLSRSQSLCGSPCHGARSCSHPNRPTLPAEEECRCHVVEDGPPPGTTMVFDPVSPPVAYCLTAAMVLSMIANQQQRQHQHHRYSSLNGRSVEPQQPRWGCLCNETYASHACCGSLTPLVWEEAEMRIPFQLAGL